MKLIEPNSSPEQPLAEASTESLEELFNRDPLTLQKGDRRRIVEALRAQRAKWQVEEAAGAKRASAPKAEPKAKKSSLPEISLSDLDDINI